MSTESKHTWKVGLASDAIVDTAPCHEGMSKDSFAWYGGNLICESVDPRHRSLILAAPALLEALERILPKYIKMAQAKSTAAQTAMHVGYVCIPVTATDEDIIYAMDALKQAKP